MQQTPNERLWLLPALALCVFGVTVAVLVRVVPGPHKELDYVVIGTVSIMVALLAVFLMWLKAGTPSSIQVRVRVTKTETPRRSDSMSILGDLSGDKA
jgi:hypothetical protein